MNPVIPAIESLAASFNGLSLWRGEQNVWGKRMNANTFDRFLYLWMHRLGFMGKAEQRLMKRLVRPGMTVVDVGANIGLYSLFLAGLVGPQGRVIAFEPDPDLIASLRSSCALNGLTNVEAINAGLGSKAARLILQRITLNSGENHLGPMGREAFRRPVEVDVMAFDDLLLGTRPDFIKVDVQGWELNVLRGMQATLRDSNPLLFIEFWPEGLRRAGSTPIELFSFVRDLGLHFYACDDGRVLSEATFLDMAAMAKGMNYANLLVCRGTFPIS